MYHPILTNFSTRKKRHPLRLPQKFSSIIKAGKATIQPTPSNLV